MARRRSFRIAHGALAGALALSASLALAACPARAIACSGDCDNNGTVAINELVLGVSIALGSTALSACAGFD